MEELQEKTLTTDSGAVYYWHTAPWDAQKQTLFFLHGMTADHTMFSHQIQAFSGAYNLLLWDAPGHGRSRPFADFTYEKAARAVQQIFAAQQLSSAIFVGQSMGGYFTQAVIKRAPKLVKAFISIGSTPYGTSYYSKSDQFWLRQVEWMARLCPLKMLKQAMANQVAVTETARENMRQMLSSYSKRELCHLMGIGYAGFLEDNCDLQMDCPVLLLLGEQDRTGKVRAYNRAWAAQTGYELEYIEHAGHNSNVDNPTAVNRAIARFVETLEVIQDERSGQAQK